jgi:hypothetical protein
MHKNEHQNVRYTVVHVTHTRWVGGEFTVRRMFVAHKGYLSREQVSKMAFEAPEMGYGAKAVVDSITLVYNDRLPEGSYITYAEYVKRWYLR